MIAHHVERIWSCAVIRSCPIETVRVGRLFGCGSTARKINIHGEVGVLKQVKPYDPGAHLPVCFLWMEHEDSTYLGFLLFDDRSFCQQVTKFLQDHCGSAIAEIGGLDVRQLG